MDGFKDSTRMKYMTGGPVKKAMGGVVSPTKAQPTKAPLGGTALTAPTATPTQSQSGNSGVVVGPRAQNARMGPVGRAKGGVMKKGNGGGVFNEKGKRATLAEMEAEDRRMAGRPSEGVSTRPTDSSGRRASDADLGMTRSAKKAVGPSSVAVSKVLAAMAKKGVPAHSDRPMIRRGKGGLSVMPKGKC